MPHRTPLVDPLWFLLVGAGFQFFVWVVIHRQESGDGSLYDGRIHRVMFFLYVIFLIGVVIELEQRPARFVPGLQAAGLLLYGLAAWLKVRAVLALGDMVSVHIKLYPNHRLVTHGPYARVRHPMLLSLVLEVLAILLVTHCWFWFTVCLPFFVVTIAQRITAEEHRLSERFGAAYRDYCRTTGPLWPRWTSPHRVDVREPTEQAEWPH